jgi:hypothetical protein
MYRWIFLFITLLGFSEAAHARRGLPLVFINVGTEMFEVGEFSAQQLRDLPELASYKPAYMCSRFGIFWADIWTWDCHIVAGQIEADSYADLPPELTNELVAKYPMSQAKRSFWNHYGFVSTIGLFAIFSFLKRKAG